MVAVERGTVSRQVRTRPLMLEVPVKVIDRMDSLAKKAGCPLTVYAGTLLMAAYTARTSDQVGDRDLDAQVARVMMLDAMETTPEEIAAHVGLKPATVKLILKGWRMEMAGRGGAA